MSDNFDRGACIGILPGNYTNYSSLNIQVLANLIVGQNMWPKNFITIRLQSGLVGNSKFSMFMFIWSTLKRKHLNILELGCQRKVNEIEKIMFSIILLQLPPVSSYFGVLIL